MYLVNHQRSRCWWVLFCSPDFDPVSTVGTGHQCLQVITSKVMRRLLV